MSLPQELHGALSLIWEEQKFTDVDFLLCGQVVPAHKAVLAAQSQYFECMLYGSMREASMSDIVLEDVPISAFRKVLQFAYTGSLHLEMVTLQVCIYTQTQHVVHTFGSETGTVYSVSVYTVVFLQLCFYNICFHEDLIANKLT